LLKYFQKKYKGAPEYREISVDGPAHKRTFRISVHHLIDGEFLGEGEGKTKKTAQQIAAKNALEKMGVEAKYI
jgi:ribonuclease-3